MDILLTMDKYANLSGNSNVVAYLLGQDFIVVQFASGRYTFYRYEEQVDELAHLARTGIGLNAALARKNHPPYTKRGSSLGDVL